MRIRYEAYSPADDLPASGREQVAHGDLDVPADAGDTAVTALLVRAVERDAGVELGAQMRVMAWRGDDPDPSICHTWDHGAPV